MTIHIPKVRYDQGERQKVVFKNWWPNQKTIQPVSKRVVSLLKCAYRNNAKVKTGHDKFIVLESRKTIVGEEKECPYFKFGDPIEQH